MEEKTSQQLIEERFKELPNTVQDAINESDWLTTLRSIISKNNLLIDQGLSIETETLLMMLGLEKPKDYTKIIKKEAKLSREQAIQIATEVEEKILSVIKTNIIERSEKEAGIKGSPLDEILGENDEMKNSLPKIDTELEEDAEEERKNLINELGGDIEIETEETEKELSIKNQFNELKKESGVSEVPNNIPTKERTLESNKIPILEDTDPNPRFIETNFSKEPDNLPKLEPVRTLETDSENPDDIVTSKLAGAEIKKPEVKSEDKSEIPQKPKGPDPYREDLL